MGLLAAVTAIPKLAGVTALCGFVFLVFGIFGMEFFKGGGEGGWGVMGWVGRRRVGSDGDI